MRKVAIANQKGGCGKTTTAINLAGALAALGKKTLLIDIDPQAHASFGLGTNNQSMDRSMYNVLTDNTDKARFITECIVNIDTNIDIVPSNILLSTLEQELKDKEDAVSKLFQVLSESQLDYKYVIMDCPPSLGFLTFNALRAADQVIVPIDMSAFSLMGVSKLLGMLELIKLKIHHAPQISALATLYDRRTKYSRIMYDEIGNFFKNQMLSTIIRLNVDLKKAAANGMTVMKFASQSIGASDYLALGQEMLRSDGASEFEKALNESSAEQPKQDLRPSVVSSNAKRQTALQAVAEPAAKRIPSDTQLNNKVKVYAPNSETPKTTIQEKPKETQERGVGFQILAPNAKDIYLVGDFNHWKINEESRLLKTNEGSWKKSLDLAPGRYKYKFVIDGEWVLDQHNNEREQNSFGTYDSVLNI